MTTSTQDLIRLAQHAQANPDLSLFDAVPALDEISVGDLVVIYSRGTERVAFVEKIGRTNVTAVYTTQGAIDSAHKIVSFGHSTPAKLDEKAADNEARAERAEAEYKRLKALGHADDEWVATSEYSKTAVSRYKHDAEYYREAAAAERERAEIARTNPSALWTTYLTVTRKSANAKTLTGWRKGE